MKRLRWVDLRKRWAEYAKSHEHYEWASAGRVVYSVQKRSKPDWGYFAYAELYGDPNARVARAYGYKTAQGARRAILRKTRKTLREALDAVT